MVNMNMVYLPNRLVAHFMGAGRKLVESSGVLVSEVYQIKDRMVLAEHPRDERTFRYDYGYSVCIWYPLTCSVGRLTGLSFQSYHILAFNALEQEPTPENPTKYVLYTHVHPDKRLDLRTPHLGASSVTSGWKCVEMVKPDRRFYLVDPDSDLADFVKTQLGKPDSDSVLEFICNALASQRQRGFVEALKSVQ